MRLPFALQSYQHPTRPLSQQRVLNMYPEAQPQDAKARAALLFCPGAHAHAACGPGPIRGMRYFRDRLICASGGQVWQVTQDGTAEALGGAPGSGPVRMADDGRWLAMVDVESAETRLLNVSDVTSITDPDFPGAKDVAVAGGFFAFLRPESETSRGQWFISDLRDPTSYDALQFISAEARPDPATAIVAWDKGLWVAGAASTEIFTNTGRNPFPFETAAGGFFERGCAAQMSVLVLDGYVYWLGNDRAVYRANNSAPQRISTAAQEAAWALLNSVGDVEATAYEAGAHKFYCLTIGGTTFCFDTATSLWHERLSRGLNRWRMGSLTAAWGGWYAGDSEDGTIWRVDPMLRLEGDAMIEREAIGAPLHGEGARMFMSRVGIEFDAGQGLATGQGSDPQAMLQWSDDGGRTWGNEHWRGIGPMGQYGRRAEWRALGQFRERTLKVRVTDPVGSAVLAVQIDVEPGAV